MSSLDPYWCLHRRQAAKYILQKTVLLLLLLEVVYFVCVCFAFVTEKERSHHWPLPEIIKSPRPLPPPRLFFFFNKKTMYRMWGFCQLKRLPLAFIISRMRGGAVNWKKPLYSPRKVILCASEREYLGSHLSPLPYKVQICKKCDWNKMCRLYFMNGNNTYI